MELPPPSSSESISTHSNPTVKISQSNDPSELCSNPNPTSKSIHNGGKSIIKKKKNKKVSKPFSVSSNSASSSTSQQKGLRVTSKRINNPKALFNVNGGGVRRLHSESDFDALALPLGMSIAAFVSQVLDRNDVADEKTSTDHLSLICTSAVKESLVNVFGGRFDCFVKNFGDSFGCTLRTLRSVNEASLNKGEDLRDLGRKSTNSEVSQSECLDEHKHPTNSSVLDSHSFTTPTISGIQNPFYCVEEEIQENVRFDPMNQELTLHGEINQQLACVRPSRLGSSSNSSMLSTLEKSVIEQARSNDLKTFEIGLMMKRLKLEESNLSLNSDSNRLERFKLSMGISKASFKAEKFKNQLEETRHAELLKKCIDCLVAGLFIMSASLVYGAYVYSYQRISEVTSSCISSPKESQSWWMPKPVLSFNSGMHMIRCQIVVVSRMLFGVFMIVAIAYLLLQRSSTSKQTMPVTYILVLLGIMCGFAGKLCVDTLGGSGYNWLLYWEALCLLHFFANICTSTLFSILHGSVSVSQGVDKKARLPYWVRRLVFYAITLVFLPLLCGLMPFAGPSDWIYHFFSLTTDALFRSIGVNGS